MNRIELRRLADDRVLDAKTLLDSPSGDRWSAAYYLAGYAIECGLKACILRFIDETGIIFRERDFSQRCFTHKLLDLIEIAGLKESLIGLLRSNTDFAGNWGIATEWSEAARYQQKTEDEARRLYEAITNDPNGVLAWIRMNW